MSFSQMQHVFIIKHFLTLFSYSACQPDFMYEFLESHVLVKVTVFHSRTYFCDTVNVNDIKHSGPP
jgi:hypothetical protein